MEKIIINGFFGKGNCGDEAILQTWIDMFSEKYDIVACVDGEIISSINEKKNKYYKKIEFITNNNVSLFSDTKVKAFIIGGGGLGLGFGVKQLLHSNLRKKKNYYLGTTVHDEFFDGNELYVETNKKIFSSYELISVRDKYSQKNLKEIFNIDSYYFPDIATGLEKEPIELPTKNKYITITIRYQSNIEIEKIKRWIYRIESFANDNSLDVIYLPFDKSDENLLKTLGKKNLFEEIYWYPKKAKFIISKSDFCFSIGRFHPLVFAITNGITPYFIDINNNNVINKYEYKNRDKNFYILNDNNLIENYLTNDDLESVEFRYSDTIELVSLNVREQNDKFKELIMKYIM